ncbi:MAG: DUF3187 family protein, partial [Bdellovibrionales bacterium]|nr:DUF3187 family protein [Bdellovibrionales bacterium]
GVVCFKRKTGSFLLQIILFLFFLADSSSADSLADSNWLSGPIRLHNQYPLDALHMTWQPEAPATNLQGGSSFNLQTSWSSTAINEETYVVDEERLELRFDYRHGFSDRLEFGAEIPLVWRGAGVLDNFITGWHDFFDLPEGDRPGLATNSYQVAGELENGDGFSVSQQGFGFKNPQLLTKYLIAPGNRFWPALAYVFGLSLPFASDGFGHHGVDLLNGLVASKRLGNWAAYGGFSNLLYGDNTVEGISCRTVHYEGYLHLEYLLRERYAFLAGIQLSSATISNVVGHPDYSVYLDTGMRIITGNHHALNLLVRENPGAGDGTVDVTLHVGYEYQFS